MNMMKTTEIDFTSEHVGQHVVAYMQEIRATPLAVLDNVDEEGTVEEIMRVWIRLSLMITRRRPEIAISSLLNHVLPGIGALPLKKVSRLRLNRLFNLLLAEGKISEAKRVFALCKQFLGWAETQGYLDHSPLGSMKRRDVGGRNAPPRERTLTDAEIWVFWHGLDMWELSEQSRWALRLCLLSARRPDEVIRARRDAFDLKAGIWRQGRRNKSQRDHTLPISPLMRECIEALERANTTDSPWLVPSPLNAAQPLSKGAITQSLRRLVRAERGLGLEPFTTRDLRRTARSKLSALGVSNDVARKIMNHALEGIDKVYDTHDYLAQMQVALDKLSADVATLITAESYLTLPHKYGGVQLTLPPTAMLYTEA